MSRWHESVPAAHPIQRVDVVSPPQAAGTLCLPRKDQATARSKDSTVRLAFEQAEERVHDRRHRGAECVTLRLS